MCTWRQEYRPIVRVQIRALLASVRADARVDADPSTSDYCSIAIRQKGSDAVDGEGGSHSSTGCVCRPEHSVRDGRNRDTHVIQRPRSSPARAFLAFSPRATTTCAPRPSTPTTVTMNRAPPSVLHTPGFAHYGLSWSPFYNNRLALASAANYGLVGNGRLHLVQLGPGPGGPPSLGIEKL